MSIFDNIEKTIFENKDYLKKEIFRLMRIELMREYSTPFTFKIVISEKTFEIKTVEVEDIRTEIEGHHTLFTANGYIEGKGWFKYDKADPLGREFQIDEFLDNVKIKLDEYLKLNLIYTKLSEVVTLSEAAEKWEISEGSIRLAIKNNKFENEIDYRKAGRITLITLDAMRKIYGEPKK